ncbi:MAG: type II secretion system protein [Planctomycetota bacterium]
MRSRHPHVSHPPAPRGFTLVEMMVTIGVIVFLAGMTVAAARAALTASERRNTQVLLDLLERASTEWENTAERQLTWWDATGPDPEDAYDLRDVHGDLDDMLILTEVLQTYRRVPTVRAILTQIEPRLVYEYEQGVYPTWIQSDAAKAQMDDRFAGGITILDSWGTPIYATHPGRPHGPGDAGLADDDGTIRTYNELAYGVASDGRMRFVSAGPDRTFGTMMPWADDAEAAADNVFSYPVPPEAALYSF